MEGAMGTDVWLRTLTVLSGRLRPMTATWPEALTTTVSRWRHPGTPSTFEFTALELEVLSALLKRPLNAVELAFVLGVKLETADDLIGTLRAKGTILKKWRSWRCTAKGRRACLRTD
jgi:hypothetical protein